MDDFACVNGNITASDASEAAPALIIVTGLIGIAFSVFLLKLVSSIALDVASNNEPPVGSEPINGADVAEQNARLLELYAAITTGANAFLRSEYKLCGIFIVLAFPAMSVLIAWGDKEDGKWEWKNGWLSGVSFVVGAITSIVCGYIGMRVAVFSNVLAHHAVPSLSSLPPLFSPSPLSPSSSLLVLCRRLRPIPRAQARCTVGACDPSKGWTRSFNTAFRAGGVMGFSLTGAPPPTAARSGRAAGGQRDGSGMAHEPRTPPQASPSSRSTSCSRSSAPPSRTATRATSS